MVKAYAANRLGKLWLVPSLLAALLLSMAVLQLVSYASFVDILGTYSFGDANVLALLLISLEVLAVPALLPIPLSRLMRTFSSTAVILVPVIWSVLAIQAYSRGLAVPNCGCFGAYFSQPLNFLVLIQDVVFLAWGVYSYKLVR